MTRDTVLIALFAALTAAMALIPAVPMGFGVPITIQSIAVMLAGGILGARRGALSMALFVLLVVAGLPLLSGGRGGMGVLFGPTGGFLVGFIPGAFVVGLLMEKLPDTDRFLTRLVACFIGGVLVVYLLGVPRLAMVADLSILQAVSASAVYIPGDLLKAVLASLIVGYVRQSGVV